MIQRYKHFCGDQRGAYGPCYMKDPKGEVVLLKDHEKAIKEAYDRGYHAGAQACSAMGGRTNY